MPNLGLPELIIILVVVLVIFGAKKIPDLAKGIGRGIKDFKKELKDDDEDKSSDKDKKSDK
jgi:sec-independent protein translocase protein TatA